MNHVIFMTHFICFIKERFYRKTNFYFALQKFYSTIQMPYSDWSVEILRNYNVLPNLTVFFLSHDFALFVSHVTMPFFLVPFRNSFYADWWLIQMTHFISAWAANESIHLCQSESNSVLHGTIQWSFFYYSFKSLFKSVFSTFLVFLLFSLSGQKNIKIVKSAFLNSFRYI